jgi:diguanylate cyclase (GGDEF)-like protein/PAS domain S-box-containing protein
MNLNLFQSHSIKTKITLFTLAIFVLGFWSLAFYASRMLREDMQRLLGEQQFSTVSILAAQVNQELDYRLRSLEQVAESVTPATLKNTTTMQALLDQRPVLQGLFNGGTFSTGLDGMATASLPIAAGRLGINYRDRDYIVAALKDGKSSIGKPAMGKAAHAPVVVMAVPIHDVQGQVIGALAGVIELGKPNFLDRITSSNYGKSGVYLIAAPQHKLFVSASDKSRIMRALPAPGVNPMHDRYAKGYEGYGTLVNYRGEEELTAAKGIPVAGWFLGIALPATEAFSPIRAMQQRMLLATFLLTLLAGGLTWWMLKRQLSPLLTTVKSLADLSHTKQHPQALAVTSQDEIGELIGGFNHLLETLGQREALLRQIMDTSSVAIFLVDLEGRIMQANRRMAEMFGWPCEALEGKEYVALVHPAERDISRQRMQALLASAVPSVDLDRLYWRADQTEFWGHLTGRRFFDANGVERGLVGVIADITERKAAEVKLRENEQKLSDILENVDAHIYLKDTQGRYLFANRPVLELFGVSLSELVGQTDEKFLDARTLAHIRGNDRLILQDGQTLKTEDSNFNPRDGRTSTYLSVKLPLRNEAGDIYALCGISTDITSLKEHAQQLEHIAHFDALTHLPNRVLLADRLHQAMAQAQRRGQRLAVIYLDLDAFKAVNDRHGHEAGDQLLVAMSARMKQALREGDTLARIGGDEFVAVLLDVTASEPMLDRLLAAAAQPVQVGDVLLQVSASLGVTFYPQPDEVDADQLLRQADQAMYQAKLAGKNRYHVFDAEQDRSVRGHHESVERIRSALREGEFVLYYQPKVNMRTGVVIGAEALIRWQHPVEGLLAPAMFLPVIEDHPLAIDIGEWVIDTALTQMERWQTIGLDIPVSVNIGAHQLQQMNFVQRLRAILAAHPQVKPGDLELEVLETSALEDLAHVSHVIETCREIGVMFALDDFGTGYSSLTYLKRLQVFQLKIDQSFVRDMLDDPDDLAILEGVIGLAGAFRRQVIAEGVETVAHGAMLLQLGCELAQGYGIARPMPAAALPGWSAVWRTDPSWADLPAVNRDDLPLLFAGAEHRAWTQAMENHLGDQHEARPPLDHEQCHFGQWLKGAGLARHGAHPSFATVDTLHRQAHRLAAELCELKAGGRQPEVLGRLAELTGLRDALLEQVNTLLHG